MKIKKYLLFFLLIFLTIQVNLTNCDKDEENILSAPVNEPTNDFTVIAEITSVGGVTGCSAVAVSIQDNLVDDAVVEINGTVIPYDTSEYINGLYIDAENRISYLEKTKYEMVIRRDDFVIATGMGYMPTTPRINNITDQCHHSLKRDLKVKWERVQMATAIQLMIYADVDDDVDDDSDDDRIYDSGLLSPEVTSHTIPDTFFSTAGEYELGIKAYYGINPDADLAEIEETKNYTKGYNLNYASGIFLISNLYPNTRGLIIIVDSAPGSMILPSRKATIKKPIQEVFMERIYKKLFEKKQIATR